LNKQYIFTNIPSDSLFSFRKIFLKKCQFEEFDISKNNIISVKLAQVLHYFFFSFFQFCEVGEVVIIHKNI